MKRVLHVLDGLSLGGRGRFVLELAARARREGLDHRLVLCEPSLRGKRLDFDPGEVPVLFLPRRHALDWRFARGLARLASELQADVLHAHDEGALFHSRLALQLMRPPKPGLVGTFHEYPATTSRTTRAMAAWAARRASCITTVSTQLGRHLVAGRWIDLFRTVRSGVDLSVFRPDGPTGGWRELLGIAPDACLIGHVGRFDPSRRQLDLVSAAKYFRDPATRPTFLFVGQGPGLAEFHARTSGLAHVHHLTHVPDLAALLRELDLFALCSHDENDDTDPRVLLEAMACACPCVASAIGDIPEIARGNGAACVELVPPRRFDLLAATIDRLMGDRLELERMGRRARRRAEDLLADEGWEVYRRLYDRTRAA